MDSWAAVIRAMSSPRSGTPRSCPTATITRAFAACSALRSTTGPDEAGAHEALVFSVAAARVATAPVRPRTTTAVGRREFAEHQGSTLPPTRTSRHASTPAPGAGQRIAIVTLRSRTAVFSTPVSV